MIVSKSWLADYVDLSMPLERLTDRLTISGLNLEGIEEMAGDTAIDLEVTSNRPDCLGHVGVAREVAVLFGSQLKKPDPRPTAGGTAVEKLTSVTLDCPELCPRYTARVIRGVKIGPSPDWLAERLKTLGIAVINNVVDITNYVLMECAQPIHAFDFAKLAGGRIVVRPSRPGERFTAINHQEYDLPKGTCVIADAERAVALGGVMGGADTEVSEATVDLLIEAADFAPLSIRRTARRLNLHSPSSFRFERGVDPEGIDWASRRCCELILELAGGELAEGVVDVGEPPGEREPIELRYHEIKRVLGIEIPEKEVHSILTALGCRETEAGGGSLKTVPPTWRADLVREIDLVEEVARIHGYDQIPEDAGVRMVASTRTKDDRVLDEVRTVMTSAGFDEAMTLSTVEPEWLEVFRGWTDAEPLATSTPVLRRANELRQSLLPSLLAARRTNETLSNRVIELFETAKVYLPQASGLPVEKRMLGITSGGTYRELKGVVEGLVGRLAPAEELAVEATDLPLFTPGAGAELRLAGKPLGYLGEVAPDALEKFDLRGGTVVAEIDLEFLLEHAQLTRTASPLSPYPPVGRDLNVVFDESVRWADVERIVRTSGGDLLESIAFQEEWRDAKRLGPGKKSLLFAIQLRSGEGTLTSEQCDSVRDAIVKELGSKLAGELRA